MKNKVYYLGICLLLFLMLGCFEDDSETAKIPLPKITILSDDVAGIQRVAEAGIEYTLNCAINWGTEDSTQYDFKWIHKGEVISTDRFGKYTFNEMGEFPLGFEIIHRSTGLTFGTVFNLTVSTRFLLGWLILAEGANEESMLHFIHIDSRELYKDVYKGIYPDKPLGLKPVRLDEIPKPAYDHIMVIQKGGEGALELDGRTFAKVILLKDQFVGEQYPQNFVPAMYISAWGTSAYGPEYVLSEDGKVYTRLDPNVNEFNQAQFPTIPLDFKEESFITTLTHFPKPTYTQFLWDITNRKWRSLFKNASYDYILPDFTQTSAYKTAASKVTGTAYNCFTGLPSGVELLYAETINEWGNTSEIVHVIRDNNIGKLYYQKIVFYIRRRSATNVQMELRDIDQYELATGYGINADTKFCLLRGSNTDYETEPHLFFSVGDKVYFFRASNQRCYLYKDFSMGVDSPAGKLVTMHTDATVDKLGFGFSDGHFYICDINLGDDILNKIARGEINPSNSADNEKLELEHYSGLGNIVHSIFKYGRFQNRQGARDDYR